MFEVNYTREYRCRLIDDLNSLVVVIEVILLDLVMTDCDDCLMMVDR